MKKFFLSCLVFAAAFATATAQQAEKLDRGVVAVKTTTGVYLSWRCLTADSKTLGFDIYRDGVKVNTEPVTRSTNYVDEAGTAASKYVVKAVDGGQVVETSKETAVLADGYMKIHLDRPAGGTTPSGEAYTYSPNDCSVGDIDGDGEYEMFVKWDPSNSHDNSESGYTGNVYIDCYKMNGTKLWRIDLGRNIRAGAHYTQFLVYDFDGDGKAELACKTAPGTIDGQGNAVLMGSDKETDDYRGTSGKTTGVIINGPEYLTVFSGQTGAEISTVSYVPLRSVHTTSQWGDVYGNRSERYLACVAYLDGQKPSIVMCRGYYTASYLCAWDFDGKNLTQRWLHASTTKGKGAYGEGAHSLTVGDVDGDGCDEIVYGSACIDHDGKLLYRTGAGHGDALHLGDFDPDHEGLEVFMVHEEKGSAYKYDSEFRDAKTGEIIWCTKQTGHDIGRGLVGNISPNWRGYEIWPGSYYENGVDVKGTFDCKGNLLVNKRADTNFRIYWDGDLLDELFDGKYKSETKIAYPQVTKRKADLISTEATWTFNQYDNAQSCNTTKATPNLQADILGDWREELVLWDGNTSSDLLVFTTTIPTNYRVPCLMQDHNYRMAIAWQNVGYNQPPHLGYYLEDVFSTDAAFTNGKGSLKQVIELGETIETVAYGWKNATSVTATGLPEGVSLTKNDTEKTFTISGTPTAAGTYEFTVTTTGGETTATLNGTITVRDRIVLTPLAYFPFEEITGGATVNRVHGTATAVGAPVLADGKNGKAASFDGTSYFTQDAYPEIQLGTKDFTIEFWFKSTDDAAYMLHKGSITANTTTGATGKWVGLEYKGGNLKFAVDDNVNKSEASAPASAYFKGEWTYVVLVRDSYTKTLKMYLNGALVAESADATGDISDNNEPLTIGNVNVTLSNFFTGEMDELTIYEGAMNANKVAERYKTATGIENIAVQGTARLTLVSATTGMVLRRGVGCAENVTSGLQPGYYILVTDDGTHREVKKFVKE